MKAALYAILITVLLQGLHAAPTEDEEALLQAASDGKENEVRRLIKDGVNVNCQSNYRNTPLYYASLNGHTKTALFLIDHGASTDLKGGSHGVTPAMHAAAFNNITLLERLVEAKANINLQDERGRTALILAVRKKNKKIIGLLLNQPQIIIKRWDGYGNKALDYAKEAGDEEIIRMLEDAEQKEAARKKKEAPFVPVNVHSGSVTAGHTIAGEPKYPKELTPEQKQLLVQLAEYRWYAPDAVKKEHEYEDLLLKIRNTRLPRLAKSKDIEVSKDQIMNKSGDSVLIVLEHETGFDVAIRTHWLKPGQSIPNRSAFAFWGAVAILSPSKKENTESGKRE